MIEDDEEKARSNAAESLGRPVFVTSALFVGFGLCLILVLTLGLMASKLLVAFLVDGQPLRFALMAAVPFLMLVGLYLQVDTVQPECVRNANKSIIVRSPYLPVSFLCWARSEG